MGDEENASEGKNKLPSGWKDIIGIIASFATIAALILTLCRELLKTKVFWTIVLTITIPCFIIFFVIWRFRGIGTWWENLSNQVRLFLIVFSIAVGCLAVLKFFIKSSSLWTWGISGAIIGIGLLLSYLSLAQRFHHHDQNLKKAIDLISIARIAASVFYLDKMKEVTLVYSHRPDIKKQCKDYFDYNEPPIPIDEAECISLINYFARAAGVDVQCKCSCELIWEKKAPAKTGLLKGNLIVLGSPMNPVTRKLHDNVREMGIRFRYGTKKSGEPSVNDIIDTMKQDEKTKEKKIYSKENNNAYGLITRMENPLNDNRDEKSYVITLGGGHRQGQKAITRWIEDPDNLHKIKEWYPDGTFQILLKCSYKGEEVITVDLVDRCPLST